MIVTSYVVGFMCSRGGSLVLVRKQQPAWQRDKLNGVGGKIEGTETPLAAMIREWREETGVEFEAWEPFARIRGDRYDVHFFKAQVPELPETFAKNDVGETIEFVRRNTIAERLDVISNLKWLLPMAFDDAGSPFADVIDRALSVGGAPARHGATP